MRLKIPAERSSHSRTRRAVDFHDAQRVGVEVDVGDILDRDRAGLHIGIIVGAAAAARI